jgi:glycosyltransferase involved in cell wall biosynthesis
LITPLVSIIIPVFNAEKYLAVTIQSAIDQTWPDKEIIIIDDGSTDDSLAIAKTYQNNYIKIFSQENKGASAARNYGLQQATGDYIQFLDADDLLNRDKIASQVVQLIQYPDHLGLCGTIHFQDGTDPLSYPLKHEWLSEGSDDPADFLIKLYGGDLIGAEYGGMVQPNAWLTPRHLIEKAGFWNETKNPDDDGEFFCRVILASKGIKYLFEGINFYRKFESSKSWSAQKSYEACCSILKGLDLKTRHLLNSTNDDKAKLALSRLYWENAFNFYPKYIDLSREAENKAIALAPSLHYQPYNNGTALTLTQLINWKTVRRLQYVKNQILNGFSKKNN